jgi:hypothetical protein
MRSQAGELNLENQPISRHALACGYGLVAGKRTLARGGSSTRERLPPKRDKVSASRAQAAESNPAVRPVKDFV